MRAPTRSSLQWLAAVTTIGLILAYFLWPAPVEVTVARVGFEPMRVTIDEDGRTRVKQRYVVSAPLEGELLRIPLRAGDEVTAGQTLVATIVPKTPEMLDSRVRAEAEAKVKVAEAAFNQAERNVAEARESHELARHQFERAAKLLATRTITTEEFEALEHRERIAAEVLRAADFRRQMSLFEIDLARAALVYTAPAESPAIPPADGPSKPDTGTPGTPSPSALPRLEVRSPITGKVFRVHQESAQVVRSGTPLVELGDPQDLEIEIDLLSSDAVRVQPGARILLENWGGSEPLVARVRHVEPSGFTKVSALGVEEQRVNVIGDFVEPLEKRPRLGDGFRVEARVVEWEAPRVLVAPAGAIFRHKLAGQQSQEGETSQRGTGWAAFVVVGGRATLREVKIGHHNGRQVEILNGLSDGEQVVVHPGDRVVEGSRVHFQQPTQ